MTVKETNRASHFRHDVRLSFQPSCTASQGMFSSSFMSSRRDLCTKRSIAGGTVPPRLLQGVAGESGRWEWAPFCPLEPPLFMLMGCRFILLLCPPATPHFWEVQVALESISQTQWKQYFCQALTRCFPRYLLKFAIRGENSGPDTCSRLHCEVKTLWPLSIMPYLGDQCPPHLCNRFCSCKLGLSGIYRHMAYRSLRHLGLPHEAPFPSSPGRWGLAARSLLQGCVPLRVLWILPPVEQPRLPALQPRQQNLALAWSL